MKTSEVSSLIAHFIHSWPTQTRHDRVCVTKVHKDLLQVHRGEILRQPVKKPADIRANLAFAVAVLHVVAVFRVSQIDAAVWALWDLLISSLPFFLRKWSNMQITLTSG